VAASWARQCLDDERLGVLLFAARRGGPRVYGLLRSDAAAVFARRLYISLGTARKIFIVR